MSEEPIVIADPDDSRDNEVRPFKIAGEISEMSVRGRAVRLGTVVDQILSAHGYPEPAAAILGEFLSLTALLGSMIKYDGIVTLQVKSEGPLPMIVSDYEVKTDGLGRLRGYVDIDEKKLAHYGKSPSFEGLIGSKKGYLAITIDQGADMERYQGIVDVNGTSLSDVARNYFKNSEQTPTAMELSCHRDNVTGNWRAGGIMVQHLARGEEGQERILTPQNQEQWARAKAFTNSVKPEELLDPQLDLDQLLYRLYHEDGVSVFDPVRIIKGCRCDRDRLLAVLAQFNDNDIKDMVVDGKIGVNCQFCNKTFDFLPQDVAPAS